VTFVLKRLSDAVKDQDSIRAVIRNSACILGILMALPCPDKAHRKRYFDECMPLQISTRLIPDSLR